MCVYLSSPASVDESADGFISSCATGVQVSPVPRLNQTHKVSTFSLKKKKTHTKLLKRYWSDQESRILFSDSGTRMV